MIIKIKKFCQDCKKEVEANQAEGRHYCPECGKDLGDA